MNEEFPEETIDNSNYGFIVVSFPVSRDAMEVINHMPRSEAIHIFGEEMVRRLSRFMPNHKLEYSE